MSQLDPLIAESSDHKKNRKALSEFGECFDRYFLIHASWLAPERKPYFEKELQRVGVKHCEVVAPEKISTTDPRLKNYVGNGTGHLSEISTFIGIIDRAESQNWQTVVIFEDDIVFRENFSELWAQVVEEVHHTDWGVLTLHQISVEHALQIEPYFGRTTLQQSHHNQRGHCTIIRKSAFKLFRKSLQDCIDRGYPVDFFFSCYESLEPGKLWATNRNLTGQRGNLQSTQNPNLFTPNTFYFRFASCRSWLEYLGYITARSLYGFIKRAKKA